MLKRKLCVLAITLMAAACAYSQVTTSSLTGVVKTAAAEGLVGATITATHQPTGTVYRAMSRTDGRYDIINMNPGGPYLVVATYVGYAPQTMENIQLALGDEYRLDFILTVEGSELTEVVLTSATRNQTVKSGAQTNISNRLIQTLPTIGRSITDFVRVTPQAGNGNTFNGRDARFNSITIDGANFNNNFGLSSNPLPGGEAQPIPLDAIEEISVNISPYDVRQGNFTGAGINAITRGGTNTFSGSVYGYYRNQDFNGRNVGSSKLPESNKTSVKQYGARIGGPIIKNKLFFFLNGEMEKRDYPGLNWMATRPGVDPSDPNVSRVTAADLDAVSQHLLNTYGYETGGYENLGNFAAENTKALARLDWNINDNHRVSLRYNYVKATNDQVTNGSSAPNPRASSNRWSRNAMAYENALYGFEDIVSSWTFDLKSKFGRQLNNQLLATYTKIETNRTSGSTPFPFVDIWEGGDQYISFGYELFSWANAVENNIFTITDNLTYNIGRHSLTAGVAYDHLYFGNSFLRYGTSYYRFNSVDDFLNNAPPAAFALTYGYNGTSPISELTFGQLAAYVQDEFRINEKLKLVGGLRVDKPIYLVDPPGNEAIAEKTFMDLDGNPYVFDMSTWPKSKFLFSPRIGFNWDLKGDRELIIRGGTGIFTGRLPFVWFTNQPTNSYALQATVERVGASAATFLFNPDPTFYANQFPQDANTLPSGASIAIVDKDFVFPQVWRTSLAFDKRLPWNLLWTVEAIYTRDVNAIMQYNANLAEPNSSFASGPDQRPRYTSSGVRAVDGSVREAMVLTNTDRGNGFSFTTLLSRNFRNGFYGQISYSYNHTMDLSSNPGSQAASAWSNLNTVNTNNDLPLAISQYSIPHRIVGVFSYRFEYANQNLATTISLFYEGSSQGRYTYKYSNDMNNDGLTNDLMYIPRDRAEAGLLIPDAAQADAFWAYVQQDNYLSGHLGQYAEPYGATMPWLHNVDLKFLQDFSVRAGGRKHTLQFSLDMLNFTNFINNKWGVKDRLYIPNAAPLRYSGMTGAGVPQFTFNQVGGAFPDKTFEPLVNVISTWGMQLGLRYIF